MSQSQVTNSDNNKKNTRQTELPDCQQSTEWQLFTLMLSLIFVLSLFYVTHSRPATDCCSSRILLLRQHTLQIKEHVVMEMQRQIEVNVNDNQRQPSLQDPAANLQFAIDSGQLDNIMQMLPQELGLKRGELATIATTERDGYTTSNTADFWSADKETTTKEATTTTTAVTASTSTSILPTATGEPPPDDDSTTRLTSEVATILDLNEAAPTMSTTTTTLTTTPAMITTLSSVTTTTTTMTPPPITSTTKLTTTSTSTTTMAMTTPTGASSKSNISDDISFKLPCDDLYKLNFCLNGGNCFRWAESNSFSYCICPDGYVGERCDSKTEDGKQAGRQSKQCKVENCVQENSRFGSLRLHRVKEDLHQEVA